ncbi:3TM-type holin [Teredinibacter sp. KSP-S5-2]|uniref:3TM-type holin n=1 Tax=Teredinibacter sp. KSP-S5-2 TaxID=3034506 RepID=UPI00293437A1|nr:hypothetical protein [Teredinibacter sp. KSP-S5-2]WNO10527.1 hypothetical protein P5V12_05010 [Teredinibacter sp. KSP-S5-2]
MLTLIGSLLGFVSSALPDLMKLLKDRQEKAHQLLILDRQIEQMKLGHTFKIDELNLSADLEEKLAILKHDAALGGDTWVDKLRASVRPVITYAFFGLFTICKCCFLYILIFEQKVGVVHAVPQIWDTDTQALFGAVMGFWFGQRAIARFRPN